jgi:hypothetical protein
MSQYDNTNKGALWKKRDDASENAPDWKIEFNVNGCDWVLAYWKRKPTDNHNGPWGRFTIENKTEQQQPAPAPRVGSEASGTIDDDILPF